MLWGTSESLVCVLGWSGSSGGRWVHSGSLWRSSGSSRVARFIGVRPGVFGFIRASWVHSESLGSLGCALGVVGFILRRWVHWGCALGATGSIPGRQVLGVRPGGRLVHQGSLGSLGYALGVVGFICDHWSAPWGS